MNYVLISPAHNEEDYIEKTIFSVLSQTLLPSRWVIVSDGSTDRTDEIVHKHAQTNAFIELLKIRRKGERNFGSKVTAFQSGYGLIRHLEYDLIGNLDADVSLPPEYFEHLIGRFQRNPRLGIAGGIIQELINGRYVRQTISLNSVAGAVQLFRSRCYEEIGGYMPIEGGGIDSAAEIVARMRGWEVRTFPELQVLHHRRVATGAKNVFRARFRKGVRNYLLGYHPLFQILSSLYRIRERPFLAGALLTWCGYCFALLYRLPRVLPPEAINFLRVEQMERIGLEPSRKAGTTNRPERG